MGRGVLHVLLMSKKIREGQDRGRWVVVRGEPGGQAEEKGIRKEKKE